MRSGKHHLPVAQLAAARLNPERLNALLLHCSSVLPVIHEDAAVFLSNLALSLPANSLVYLDPPYYDKGQHLYTNYYHHDDHKQIAQLVRRLKQPWIVSYDNCPEIQAMYRGFRRHEYELGYSARERRRGAEVMFFAPDVRMPESFS